jgi:hypothetical protein
MQNFFIFQNMDGFVSIPMAFEKFKWNENLFRKGIELFDDEFLRFYSPS